jgi:hypothetical protein
MCMYIHRNLLRARIGDRLADYPWSSYPALAYGGAVQEKATITWKGSAR